MFTFIYLVPPTLSRPPQSRTFDIDRTAFLECGVNTSTFPEPTVKWFRGSTLVNSGGSIFISPDTKSLIIMNTMTSDSGIYTCEVTNVVGTIRHNATVTVKDIRANSKQLHTVYTVSNLTHGA